MTHTEFSKFHPRIRCPKPWDTPLYIKAEIPYFARDTPLSKGKHPIFFERIHSFDPWRRQRLACGVLGLIQRLSAHILKELQFTEMHFSHENVLKILR